MERVHPSFAHTHTTPNVTHKFGPVWTKILCLCPNLTTMRPLSPPKPTKAKIVKKVVELTYPLLGDNVTFIRHI